MAKEFLIGRKYVRLLVLDEYKIRNGVYRCICRCDCGNIVDVNSESIKYGHTKSCGCLRKEGTHFTNRLSKTRFYHIYLDIKRRCDSPKSTSYYNYGARGITYLWKSFEEFRDDMYESYLKHSAKFGEKDTFIDRIDPNGNYCKDNCRWATRKEQNSNQRRTIFVTDDFGNKICLKDYCKLKNLTYSTIQSRIFKLGWSVDDAINTPIRQKSN